MFLKIFKAYFFQLIDFSNNPIKELNVSIFMNNKNLSIINKSKNNLEEDRYRKLLRRTKLIISSFIDNLDEL